MKKIKRFSKIKIPVLWKFIIMYLLISMLIIAALTPIYYKVLELSKLSYLADVEYSFKKNGVSMQNTLKRAYEISTQMDESPYYVKLKLMHPGDSPLLLYSKLYMSHKYFLKQMATFDDIDEAFLYLPNSYTIFGKKRVFDSAAEYFNFDVIYRDYSPDEILQWMSDMNERFKILPATLAKVHGGVQKSYLTIVMSRPGDSAITGVLLSEETLLNQFNISNLPVGSFLYITDKDNKVLFSYGYDDKEPLTGNLGKAEYDDTTFSVLKTTIAIPGCNITLGIPDYHFEEMYLPLKKMIYKYICVAMGIGILFSILFALNNYIPIKKLASIPLKNGFFKEKDTANEYSYINKFMESCSSEIKKLKTDILNMENTLRTNMLIKLLYGMVNSKDEYALVSKLIPQVNSPFRIALFEVKCQSESQNADYIGYIAYDKIQTLFPGKFMHVQLNNDKVAMIFADTEDNLKELKKLFITANQELYGFGISLNAGISDRFENKDEINKAFFHAQSSLTAAENNGLNFYSYDLIKQSQAPKLIDFYGIQKLYGLIIARNKEAVEETIKEITRKLIFGGANSKHEVIEVFCLIRFVIASVIADTELEIDDFSIIEFREDESIDVLFKSLCKNALAVMEAFESKKRNANKELKERIMKYIENNFADPDIYADSIAEKFNISRNYVYNLVREETGKSLNDYIEHLRMKRAIDLLKSTNMLVSDISAECGYNSTNTFYKVFKKVFNVSPSTFRSGLHESHLTVESLNSNR
ncbi:helix-turn-helix domain-containing protein [Clostridium thermosuccinogenes]|nr:helix-turn-helix domain-containing protein [Pseudoclostridium thermosuccinogenes]